MVDELKKEIDFAKIEQKWQKKWADAKTFESKESKKKKYYVLEMFPYPSASFLHMGHVRNYTIGDIIARFKRMQGFNVLYPMGYDSFGLPAENAAKKEKQHPEKYTENAIKQIKLYQTKLGNSYDWRRTLATHEPEYYKWNQYFFIKFFEKGLAYRKKAPVNWCPSCETVLANEEVEKGKCWRCESEVQTKDIEQWFLKITAYADELLRDISKLEWSDRIKAMQQNWIGKSEGTEILFEINKEKWPIFTTRPDTIFGVTFMVISAQHPKLMELVTKEQKKEVEKFLKKIKETREEDIEKLNKEGVFTGSYAINPLTKEKVPVWAGNFVVADYGSGMVMAVPAHDQRDFEFAQKYEIPIKVVIRPERKEMEAVVMDEAYTSEGKLINSEGFDDLFSEEAKVHITKALEAKKLGRKTTNYKIRDWLISRQRYWGTPIPMVYCDKCGIVPVNEKELPILLPEDVKFGGKSNPILTSKKFQDVKCPRCKGKARRETDTMGGFMDSSWYFLRYCDPHNEKSAFDKEKVAYWMPVDQYIGGIEHAVGHLIYSRFFTKVLRDMGLVKIDEPFMRLFNQGVVYKDGKRMSKSHGNTITQEEISKKCGIDSARLFLMFVASPESDMEWSDEGIEGISRFVRRIFELKAGKKEDVKSEHYRNKFIRDITLDINNFKFNMAIIKLMKFLEIIRENSDKQAYEDFLKMLSVFAPHISEELWEKLGNKSFVSVAEWPKFDENKINERFEKEEKNVEKTIEDIINILKIVKEKEGKEGEKIYIYVIPNELENYNAEVLTRRIGKKVEIFAVNDKKKYDPSGKSSKAKPGKPGIFVE
jgi:leucyl-tRNA synthetase